MQTTSRNTKNLLLCWIVLFFSILWPIRVMAESLTLLPPDSSLHGITITEKGSATLGTISDIGWCTWDIESGNWIAIQNGNKQALSIFGNRECARGHNFQPSITNKISLFIRSFANENGEEVKPHLKYISIYNHEASFQDK